MSDLDRYFEEFGSALVEAQRPKRRRRRRTAVAAVVGVGAVSVSVGIAIAANVIRLHTEIAPSPFYAPKAVTTKAVAANGRTSKGPYSLRAFTDDRGYRCLELTQGSGLTGGCGRPPNASDPIGGILADQSPRSRDRLIFGLTAENVASVDLRTATIHLAAATHGHLDGGDHVFVILLPAGPRQQTVLTARDRSGRLLYQRKL